MLKGKRIYDLIGWSILWFAWNYVLSLAGLIRFYELDGSSFWNFGSIEISNREICRWLMLRLPLYCVVGRHMFQLGHMRNMHLLRFCRYSDWQRALLLDLARYISCWQLMLLLTVWVREKLNLYESMLIIFSGIYMWCMCSMFGLFGELYQSNLWVILMYVWNFIMVAVGCRNDNVIGKFCLLMAGTVDFFKVDYVCLLLPCVIYGLIIGMMILLCKKYMIESR